MPGWLGVTSGAVVLGLVVVSLACGRRIGRLRRQLEEAELHATHLRATDQLIEFRMQQLGDEMEQLDRAREELSNRLPEAHETRPVAADRIRRGRRIG